MLNVSKKRVVISGLQRYSQDVKNLYKFFSEEENENQKYRTLDEKDYKRFLSKRALTQKPAPTRQLIAKSEKSTRKICRSLGEGMPNEYTFPFTNLELTTRSGDRITIEGPQLDEALQYIPPRGQPDLRTELNNFQQELHRPPPLPRNLLITTGGQHGIFLCVELLVDHGDPIICTEYSYTGLNYILKPYNVEYIGIKEDKDGLIPEELESVLNTRLKQGLKMPKVLFVVPTGSNPTGFLLSESRKRRIYEIACKYDLIIVEDEVYMFLNYTDKVTPSFLSLDTTGRVVRIDSISKVVSAGLRVGWLTGPQPLIRYTEFSLMSQMLHSCSLAQSVTYSLMADRDRLTAHIQSTINFYKKQKDYVNNALKKIEDLIEWEDPAGGYFHWVKIRGLEDVRNMVFNTAFKHGLMLEPGHNFSYNTERPSPYIRLTFTRMNLEQLDNNVNTIRDIIIEERKLQQKTFAKSEKSKGIICRTLGEGMPNEYTFPFTNLELTTRSGDRIIIEGPQLDEALQYISAKGLPCLHQELSNFQQELHRPPPLPRSLLLTNGAQHGIHLCTELLVDHGDPVIATEYSYFGLHYALKPYHVEFIGLKEDKDGLIPEELESVLNTRMKQGLKMPRVLFVVPTFSNPTNFLLSESRKRRIYEIACKYDLIIVEDEVYMFLNYTDTVIPSFLSLDTTGRVVRIDSISKVVSAGLRVGWLTGPQPLIRYTELTSMSQIMHPCAVTQSMIYSLITDRELLTKHLLSVRCFYKKQKDCVNNALKKIEDLIEWEEPEGGYYHWIKIRGLEDVRNMVFNTAFKHGLMLEPGHNFSYDTERPSPYIRLTFTRMNLEQLDDNINTIRDIIIEERKLQQKTC
ncbi:unnamed protein product [Danaus chrysippus]|uniref:(African queen) hypothetical protein n=1 Tax=Danaus chrysippus TaxID=151541 RepID=A0A8J2QWU7_9NEOP|nr:unnamed protein product [Danaus chrysippus]